MNEDLRVKAFALFISANDLLTMAQKKQIFLPPGILYNTSSNEAQVSEL